MNGARVRWVPGSFLHSLTPEACAELLGLGVPRRFPSGRRLLRQGERNSHVEILLSGFLKITTLVEGLEALQAIRMPGDIVGETGALSGRPRMANVTTCGRVTASVVSGAGFRRFLRQHPDAAFNMTAIMGERLRWANQRRSDFAAYPAEVRLARILYEIATTCGQRTDAGLVIDVSLSQPELATMIGIANATAEKAIRDLRARGIIHTGYRRITVVDLDALAAMAYL
jgi:CRP-like cAMP-binding protein